jgi:putative RecB family exonuclease
VDKLPTEPATYLSFGTSVHAALEAFHERTLFGRPTLEDLHQFLYDNWDSTGYAHVPRAKQVEDYQRAKLVLTRYHRRVGDAYRPAADTEKWFELPIGDTAVVVGSIDRVDVDDEGDYHVVDYKTGKLRDVQAVRKSLQLALYALACEHLYGRLPASVSLDFVVAGTEVRVPVDELDLDGARQAVLDTADAVLAERYEPNPTRLCDWCDHRALCPAWEGPDPAAFGPAVVRLTQLRRQVQRDVAELRALEAAVEHGRQALIERGLDPVVSVAAGDLRDDGADVGDDDGR